MDEEITIINSNTRNEKIKNFFLNNKKKLIGLLAILILILISYFAYGEFKNRENKKISNLYNNATIEYSEKNINQTVEKLKIIINKKHPTYSPLSLYFIIENNLIIEKEEINELFDVLINKTSLEKEIKNLIIYKKGLYNADSAKENELLDIINPLINSNSVWKAHALYLVAEYFYSKNEKQKSKEFFNQILSISNVNQEILQETQKRLNRDLGD
jgi:predicted negative regulator of RcsB-dependent stress response